MTAPAGVLWLVGTPIGNLGDLTDGALACLRAADVVCAEDTRRTRGLLTAFDVHPSRLVSIRAETEAAAVAGVLDWLAQGLAVALVTDAGMPGISDPGEVLVRGVVEAGGAVAVAPGPDAATTALLASGLPVDRWCFEGFLPRKGSDRAARLAALRAETATAVVYEAPHRLLRTLADLEAALGPDRPVAVAKDVTKRFERIWRGPVAQVRAELDDADVRGEFVLVIGRANG